MKTLLQLAQELGFNHAEEYLNYIISSLINGNRSQVRALFNAMSKEDQRYFLSQYLNDDDKEQTEVHNICIQELTK